MSEKRVKVTFANGFQTELRESVAKVYESKGKVKIDKPKGPKPKKSEPQHEAPKSEGGE